MKHFITLLFMVSLVGCAIQRPQVPPAPTSVLPLPQDYKKIVEESTRQYFKDPDSAKYRFPSWSAPQPCSALYANTTPAYRRGLVGKTASGYCGFVAVNAKNSYGGYVGEEGYLYILNGNDVILFEQFFLLYTNPDLIPANARMSDQ